ncbi:MraZ-like protein [Pirellulimonas nuda]|uniref:Transcriptional regulator MraZ n=1 Tax=Pirellulimonas nuda TaxID=2528009 RepID=A0A518DHQ9_9BACT|nr:division/cell wall cluster transcriptional repressor MraZ [Pirellulimonas nuda]QDU91004.1 MraZ-like protein [Pirellulimonas nuda]
MLLGEVIRTLDDRFRLTLPADMAAGLCPDGADACMLAKERPGCVSLWPLARRQAQIDEAVALVRGKLDSGRLAGRQREVQALGRLLSTRHQTAPLAGRGRLVVPEGFREFLGVEPGGSVVVIGAAVCVEVWRPDAWAQCVGDEAPRFDAMLEDLIG